MALSRMTRQKGGNVNGLGIGRRQEVTIEASAGFGRHTEPRKVGARHRTARKHFRRRGVHLNLVLENASRDLRGQDEQFRLPSTTQCKTLHRATDRHDDRADAQNRTLDLSPVGARLTSSV